MSEAIAAAPVGVAILEDYPMLLQTITSSMSAVGFEIVVSTADPKFFFAALEGRNAVVAIVELQVPREAGSAAGVEGLAVLQRLAEKFPAVRSIIYSGDTRPETFTRCVQAGAW